MPVHFEPRGGDYAAYIEDLVNHGSRSPGQTLAAPRTKIKRKKRWSTDSLASVFEPAGMDPAGAGMGLDPAVPQPFGRSSPPPAASAPSPSRAGDRRNTDGAPETLAGAARRRLLGMVLTGAGFGLLFTAFTMFMGAMSSNSGMDAFVPALFLLFFSSMLIRAGRAARGKGKQPAKPLPPLTTLSSSSRNRRS